MRPDDPQPGFDDLMDAGMDLPFDAALEVLDRSSRRPGTRRDARSTGDPIRPGSSANQLRAWLLDPAAGSPAEETPSST